MENLANGCGVMSPYLPYIIYHMYILIGLFALAEVGSMSSSSFAGHHHRHKKQKHRHHKHHSRDRSMDDNVSDMLKSIQEEMKSISQRIFNIKKGQAAIVQSTADKVEEKSTTENIVE